MITLDLQKIPNQSFSIRLDNNLFDLTIKEANGIMAVTISLNGTVIESGNRIVSGYPLIPYPYLSDGAGNFVLITDNQEYPYYTQFGITQFLIYATQDEIDAL